MHRGLVSGSFQISEEGFFGFIKLILLFNILIKL